VAETLEIPLEIPLEELREELKAGKLDEDFGRWFLRTRTGTHALETLQRVTGKALFLELKGVTSADFSFGMTVSEIGKAMRPNVRESNAFLVAFQAEELEWSEREAERIAREAWDRR